MVGDGVVSELQRRALLTQHFNSPLQGADANGYVSAPLTYGITLRMSF